MKYQPIAIVTGATRGIGKEILKRLSSNGLSCLAIGSSKESISKIKVNEHLYYVKEGQKHRSLAIDLATWPQWGYNKKFTGIEYYSNSTTGWGEYPLFDKLNFKNSSDADSVKYYVSMLVNCAGITQESISLTTSPEEMQRILNVNFQSSVGMCNMVVRRMIKEQKFNFDKPKHIINISSVLGNSAIYLPGTSIYSASKAALTQYTHILNEEVKTLGIMASVLNLGLIPDTSMIKNLNNQNGVPHHLHQLSFTTSTPDSVASQVLEIYQSVSPTMNKTKDQSR